MKKNLILILAALWVWGGLPARANAQAEGLYLTPKLGVTYFSGRNTLDVSSGAGVSSLSSREHKNRFVGALALGYGFSDYGVPLRMEVEFALRSPAEWDSTVQGQYTSAQKITANTLMFNAYLDFENDTAMTPYIGAGLGLALTKGETRVVDNAGLSYNASDSSNGKFAWSLTAGSAWDLTDNLALDLGYRYFNINDVSAGSGNTGGVYYSSSAKKIALHEIMLGLRISAY